MAILATADLRDRIAAQIATLPGWSQSPYAAELFPLDPDRFADHTFAVLVSRTRWTSGIESSRVTRGTTIGGLVESEIRVRWARSVRPEAGPEDTDSAMADEILVVEALCDSDLSDLHIRIEESTRELVADTWLLCTVSATATHRYAIE